MATTQPTSRLSGLAYRLVNHDLLTEDSAREAQEQAQKKKIPLVNYLIENGLVDAPRLASTAASEFGLPLMELGALDTTHLPNELLDKLTKERVIQDYHVLPLFKRGKRLFVGVSDPASMEGIDRVRFATGLTAEPVIVEEPKLRQEINRLQEREEQQSMALDDEDLEGLELEVPTEEGEEVEETSEADEAPVVRFINKVLMDAIKRKASDIHFEPYEKKYRVRFRMDGVLTEITSPPLSIANRITARLKVMSRMDISERRIPQDGRIKLKISKTRAIDFRVNTCPTLFGEKVVCRILDPSSAQIPIEKLGYEPEQKAAYLHALSRPQGMILVTGPTGSGKTVSLYTGLNRLNEPERNISTAEDPAEINLPGVNQVNVNPRVGLTFAEALRSFLRQDPDVVMVGEIRDLETAEIAVKAAQTGHLVLSTLHTNDAPQTLARLMNIGIPSYNIASSVILIIAQRLGRRLCEACKAPDDIPPESLIEAGFQEDELPELTIYKAVGCSQCNRGYKGRVGIFQVMPISDAMAQIIMENGNAIQLAKQAEKEGISDLRRSGLRKVKQGVTSLEEIMRVTQD
jgi:type IV pilus assembly protein PilB